MPAQDRFDHWRELVGRTRSSDLRPVDDRERCVVRGVGVDFPEALLPLPPYRVRELLGKQATSSAVGL